MIGLQGRLLSTPDAALTQRLGEVVLQLGLPEAVEVAVLIYGDGLTAAYANLCLGFVFQVNTQTAILKLYIYESDVVFGKHRVLHAAHFDTDAAVVYLLHNGEVFLLTCIYGAGDELGHFLAAAEGGYAAINGFDDYVATAVAFEKFGSHSYNVFWLLNFLCLICFNKDNTILAENQIGNSDGALGKTYSVGLLAVVLRRTYLYRCGATAYYFRITTPQKDFAFRNFLYICGLN